MRIDDLIRRQDVIDLLKYGVELLNRSLDCMDVVGQKRKELEYELELLEGYIHDVEELPSAHQDSIGCKTNLKVTYC